MGKIIGEGITFDDCLLYTSEHIKPEDRMKFEIAKELGLADKVVAGGWRSLTAKESGRIGGLMTKKKRELRCV